MKQIALLVAATLLFTMPCSADKKGKEKPKGDPKLQNTVWKLLDINGQPLTRTPGSEETYIIIAQKHNRLDGFAGCSPVSGSYKLDKGDVIEFDATITPMPCKNQSTENYLRAALDNANRYMLNGQNLLLYNDNLLLAIFEAKD
jgi:heat shock protein HslJ